MHSETSWHNPGPFFSEESCVNINYKKVRVVLEHQFEWMKHRSIFLIASMLMLSLVTNYINFYFIKSVFIIGFWMSSCLMLRSYSLEFEWKFLQSLSLSKVELIFTNLCSILLSSIPLLLWIYLYWDYVTVEIFQLNIGSTFSVFVNCLLLMIWGTFSDLNSKINTPRKAFIKLVGVKKIVRTFRNKLGNIWVIILSFFTLLLLKEFYSEEVRIIIKHYLVWLATPVLIFLIIQNYRSLFQTWQDEKLSYKDAEWIPKKEYGLTFLYAFPLVVLLFFSFSNTALMFKNDLYTSIEENDFHQVEYLLSAGNDINMPNSVGFTPMMVALKAGNLEMVKFLESKGANYEGMITKKTHERHGFDSILYAIYGGNIEVLKHIEGKVPSMNKINKETGYYPIHLAAAVCKPQIVDFLIEKGADVEALNNDNETPAMVAARQKCFPAIVSLKEAGANLAVIQKMNLKNLNEDIAYFVRKNNRAPASE